MSELIHQHIFRSNERSKESAEPDFQSLDLLIVFDIYRELMSKELLNLKQDVNNATRNFETLVLEFQNVCDDIV